jgi:hypothetical protein
MKKVCIVLVLIKYVYHNTRFKKRKINNIICMYRYTECPAKMCQTSGCYCMSNCQYKLLRQHMPDYQPLHRYMLFKVRSDCSRNISVRLFYQAVKIK